MRKSSFIIIMAAFVLAAPLAVADAADTDDMLIDMGNGETYWVEGITDPLEAVQLFAEEHSLSIKLDGSSISALGGMYNHSNGSVGCRWQFLTWDGGWQKASVSSYVSGCCAFAFYPDDIRPTATPDHRTVWTQTRGDSSGSGVSGSYGTADAVTPVEWYRTYTTGYVDSNILVAGGMIYHTTYGADRQSGPDSHAWMYCEDRFTGEEIWKFDLCTGGDLYPDATAGGYNITSPLIVGDVVLINSAKAHSASDGSTVMILYSLDRFTGELLDYEEILHAPPYDRDGNVLWTGRTFVNGGSTPVYDSGAVYFGTSDGRVLSYVLSSDGKLSRNWEYVPPSTVSGDTYIGSRGSIYFHAPTVTDVDGKRVLFIGNYQGFLLSVDASTGKPIWSRQLVNLGEDNKPCPGTPGSVGSVAALPNGTLLVGCSDGGLSSITGYVACVDASTGDMLWKKNVLIGGAVVADDGLYAYIGSSSEQDVLKDTEGNEVELYPAVYKLDFNLDVIWQTGPYQTVKSGLTLADGAVYMMDYSAGALYPTGGCLTAVSAEDGSEIWRLLLEPCNTSSYSMVSPTVIDGKIYVGNDYGAVYCVSEVRGEAWSDTQEIVLEGGFDHWSWYVLAVTIAVAFLVLIRYY